MSELPFSHLRVELRGLTVAGRVWNAGDLVPLDGSTLVPVHRTVLEQCAALEHPHLTPGNLRGKGDDVEFVGRGHKAPFIERWIDWRSPTHHKESYDHPRA